MSNNMFRNLLQVLAMIFYYFHQNLGSGIFTRPAQCAPWLWLPCTAWWPSSVARALPPTQSLPTGPRSSPSGPRARLAARWTLRRGRRALARRRRRRWTSWWWCGLVEGRWETASNRDLAAPAPLSLSSRPLTRLSLFYFYRLQFSKVVTTRIVLSFSCHPISPSHTVSLSFYPFSSPSLI